MILQGKLSAALVLAWAASLAATGYAAYQRGASRAELRAEVVSQRGWMAALAERVRQARVIAAGVAALTEQAAADAAARDAALAAAGEEVRDALERLPAQPAECGDAVPDDLRRLFNRWRAAADP